MLGHGPVHGICDGPQLAHEGGWGLVPQGAVRGGRPACALHLEPNSGALLEHLGPDPPRDSGLEQPIE
eukprot:1869397-Alexandrium_andersonii.AAC.1